MNQQANVMEHIYKVDEEEFAKSISRKVIEKLSHFEISNDETEGTLVEVISQESNGETKA